jgi:hypothetical protein
MDMIQDHHSAVQHGRYTAIDLAVYTAEVLAYTMLSRVSEYLYTGDGSHTLMSEDIQQFEMQDGTVISAKAAYRTGFSKVTGCIFNIKSAINDAAGRGHRYFFAKSNPAKEKPLYCIVWTL